MFNFIDFFGNHESNLYSRFLLNDYGLFINTGDNIDIEKTKIDKTASNQVEHDICCNPC